MAAGWQSCFLVGEDSVISSLIVLKTLQSDRLSVKEDRARLDLAPLETDQIPPVKAPC